MKKYLLITLAYMLFFVAGYGQQQHLNLEGVWRFAMDPGDVGIDQCWYGKTLTDHVTLPGTMLVNSKGNPVDTNTPWIAKVEDQSFWTDSMYAPYRQPGNVKYPCWLQPDLYYSGAAWYQRDIEIPQGAEQAMVSLYLERVHWQTMVWVDSTLVGQTNALGAPHEVDLTGHITAGTHTLTIRVDNRLHHINPGENAHSISDHTQGNWNGIVGRMEIQVKPHAAITHLDIFPSAAEGKITVEAEVWANQECDETLELGVDKDSRRDKIHLYKGRNHIITSVAMSSAPKLWDEFSPNLYRLKYRLAGSRDQGELTFGFRDMSVSDGRLLLNGHPAFMRGTLHCGAFPVTGFPSTDKEEWIREFKACKSYGLNHIRFHSWCPPEAAFEAADELGMYLQVECSAWCFTLGDGGPTDQYLVDESKRIVRAFGNHPSFCLMTYGNEPDGPDSDGWLTRFTEYWKTTDRRRLYAAAAGWPDIAPSDYLNDVGPRIQGWGEGLESIINSQTPSTSFDWSEEVMEYPSQPIISHEVGQWCVYPDLNEIEKYKGVYKARNLEIFKDFLANNGMQDLADDFLHASGRLQTLCYKADIEAALRTPRFAGFQLLGINDFPGQGTAPVGAMDAFWDSKPYTSAEEYRNFCNNVVPLARMDKLIFANNENFRASIELANFKEEMTNKTVGWHLRDMDGNTIGKGTLAMEHVPLGNCLKAGKVECSLNSVITPRQMELEVSIDEYSNHWNCWVYPSDCQPQPHNIVITDALTDDVLKTLQDGHDVLLSIRKGTLRADAGGDIQVGFSSIFWNTAWTGGQPPHTLGILCNPRHQSLAEFPTEGFSNYQWHDAMTHCHAIRLDKFQSAPAPIVRIIDDWFKARPLALLFECRVGKGRLMVSGVDFFDNMDNRPAGRQLLISLLDYMNSKNFRPQSELNDADLQHLRESIE